ncbi:MAG: adenosylcobinamide-GDP ribazoletransferase [Anaerolineae bacterium]|nr:MAG: adenosylcobinamide-GDP ribazoletransferase [Anaerolineae bacterium]
MPDQLPEELTRPGSWGGSFFASLQFLTTVPAIIRRPFTLPELGRAVAFYPLIGALLGLVLAGVWLGLGRVFDLLVVAGLTLTAWVLFTGGLHLDGLMDSADGVLGGNDLEQRLLIMKDERVGAFGALAGGLALLMKFALLAQSGLGWVALPVAALAGRWGMAVVIVAFPPARPEGLGSMVKAHARPLHAAVASAIAAGLGFTLAGPPGLLALVIAGLSAWALAAFTLRRLPGLTGDIYGAICEILEIIALLVLSLG